MKYLVIPIGSISDESIEEIVVATLKARDLRGLKVQLNLQTVYFQSSPFPERTYTMCGQA